HAEVGHQAPRHVLARRIEPVGRHLADALDDRLDAPELALDRLDALVLADVFLGRRLLLEEALEQLDLVDEHLERIVDLVREADSELSERDQLVVLAQPLDVLGKADAPLLAAFLVVDDRAGDRHRNAVSVLGDELGLEGFDLAFAVAHRVHHAAGFFFVGVEAGDGSSEDLVGVVTERVLGTGVVENDYAFAVHGHDDVGRRIPKASAIDPPKLSHSQRRTEAYREPLIGHGKGGATPVKTRMGWSGRYTTTSGRSSSRTGILRVRDR